MNDNNHRQEAIQCDDSYLLHSDFNSLEIGVYEILKRHFAHKEITFENCVFAFFSFNLQFAQEKLIAIHLERGKQKLLHIDFIIPFELIDGWRCQRSFRAHSNSFIVYSLCFTSAMPFRDLNR